jgi:hypothetical protein
MSKVFSQLVKSEGRWLWMLHLNSTYYVLVVCSLKCSYVIPSYRVVKKDHVEYLDKICISVIKIIKVDQLIQ